MTFGIDNFWFRELKDGGDGENLQEELVYEYNINSKNRVTYSLEARKIHKKIPRLAAGLIFLSPTNDYVLL